MFNSFKQILMILALLQVLAYNALVIQDNGITLERIVEDINYKMHNNKMNEINIFEKWIINYLVGQNIKKKANQIEQKEFWMFRQG